MAKIKDVMYDYDDGLPVFGVALIITLDNEQTIFLSIESKANDPEYKLLKGNKRLPNPQTDGDSVYWQNGPRLTLDEIIEMLRADGSEKI